MPTMTDLPPKFNFRDVEDKWIKFWEEKNCFHAEVNPQKKPYSIVIPPPNVTGILHMGHALNNTLQDIMIRYKRMQGFETLWMPGTDHAGIATQNVVEKDLAKEGKKRHDLGREAFLEKLWDWKKKYGDTILYQLRKLGSSCDWTRTRFTMDEAYSEAVRHVFVKLYEKGLIYRGEYIINWCPRCQTALSDEEAEHREVQGNLYHIRYSLKDSPEEFLVVATTRPETMLGDTAVAVNPKDKRYKNFIGKTLILPLMEREIPVIADELVDPQFGTGAVKVTPAHDPNDFEMGRRHKLPFINIMRPDAVLNENAGEFAGMDRFEAREAIIEILRERKLLVKVEPHTHAVGHCYRCHTVVEPYLSKQWFVKMKPLAKPAADAVRTGKIKFYPERWTKVYLNWMDNIRDWCISRQIWWGHQIPVWYCLKCNPQAKAPFIDSDPILSESAKIAKSRHWIETYGSMVIPLNTKAIISKEKEVICPQCGNSDSMIQDPDVLDTWFSSWLWPFATLGWPTCPAESGKENPDLKYFYPTASLFTASEIIFFWVARMIMAGLEFRGDIPFSKVYIHGTVRDAKGRKMSKSLGNAIDPLEIISEYGADALRFSLIINSGQDIFISKDKFEIGRNFANKVWNATRFILMNADQIDPHFDLEKSRKGMDLPSRWIISKFYTTLEDVNLAIENFRFSEAETLIYDFFWGNFCDWYLEIIKNNLTNPLVQNIAFQILEMSLKMIHPFMPFVTEEIWSQLPGKRGPLCVESWPRLNKHLIDEPSLKQMEKITAIVSAIRNIRAQWNIKPQDKICCYLTSKQSSHLTLLIENKEVMSKSAGIAELAIEKSLKPLKNIATALIEDIKIAVPLEGIIDIEKEKKRIFNQIEEQKKISDNLSTRLKNKEFIKKAPEEVIAKEKERLVSLENKIKELEHVLANFQ